MGLVVVSTPIGNAEDITHRALRVLREVDSIVCEEHKAGAKLLSHYGIQKPLVELNEHTEAQIVPTLVRELLARTEYALISDHGTPLVEDPGGRFVWEALRAGVIVSSIPGASATIAALVASGIPAKRWLFLGQLPRKAAERRRTLRNLSGQAETMIFLDAPYRLAPVLEDIGAVFGPSRQMAVACDLTLLDESIIRGSADQVIERFKQRPFKGEFTLIVEGNRPPRSQRS